MDALSEFELTKLQEKNIRKITKSALENVPFYKQLNISLNDALPLIQQFPVIDKHDIRNYKEQLISTKHQSKKLISYSSSGSSGVQTTVYMTKEEQSIIRGILTHWWEWSGYSIGNSIVQTGITPNRGLQKSLKDMLFKTIYLNAFSHTEEQLKRICSKIEKHPNKFYIAGYASSLNILAEYATEHKFDIQIRAAISLGDKLFKHYRKQIESIFKTKVFDTYGTNEGLMIAAQDDLEYYYILSPHVYVEILDDENNVVPDGEMGNVVVTRLDNYAMPLILRYKVGDLAIKLPRSEYPNERKYQYPLLKTVIGRETDVIILPDNTKMVVYSFTGIFEYIPEISQFKVIQEDKKGIIIEYIKSETFHVSALDRIKIELKKYIQNDLFTITLKEVNYITPTKSGKPQLIESRLKL